MKWFGETTALDEADFTVGPGVVRGGPRYEHVINPLLPGECKFLTKKPKFHRPSAVRQTERGSLRRAAAQRSSKREGCECDVV